MKTYLVRGIKIYDVELCVDADNEIDAQKEFLNATVDDFDEFVEMDSRIDEIEELEDDDIEYIDE